MHLMFLIYTSVYWTCSLPLQGGQGIRGLKGHKGEKVWELLQLNAFQPASQSQNDDIYILTVKT